MNWTSQCHRHVLLSCSTITLIVAGVLGLGQASLVQSEVARAKEVRDANGPGASYSYSRAGMRATRDANGSGASYSYSHAGTRATRDANDPGASYSYSRAGTRTTRDANDPGASYSYFHAGTRATTEKPKVVVRGTANGVSVERWIVMPVTTPLQRLSMDSNTRAYVVVDGGGLRQDRLTLNCESLDLDGLRTQLLPCASTPGATVHFRIRSAFRPAGSIQDGFGTGVRKQDSHDPVTWVLQCALVGMGRYAGFSEATALPVYTEADALPDWSTLLAEWKRGLADDAGRDEPMIGNTKFEVYPVRTTLSRLIYCRADCVLRVLGTLGPEDLEQIEQSVAKLELSRKDWLYILARSMADLSSATEPTFHKGRLGFEQVILDTTQK